MGKQIHYFVGGAAFFLVGLLLGLWINGSAAQTMLSAEMAQSQTADMAKQAALPQGGGSCSQAVQAVEMATKQVAENCSDQQSSSCSTPAPRTCTDAIQQHLSEYSIGKVAVIKDAAAEEDNLTGAFEAQAADQIAYAKVLPAAVTADQATAVVAAAEKAGAQEILVDASADNSALIEKASTDLPVEKVTDLDNCYRPDNCVADIAGQAAAAKKVAYVEVNPFAEKTACTQALGMKLVDDKTVAAAAPDQMTAAADVAAAMPAVATALKAEAVDTAVVSATDQETPAIEAALAKVGIKTVNTDDYKCQPTAPSTPAAPTAPAKAAAAAAAPAAAEAAK